jgi:hypothetical protein
MQMLCHPFRADPYSDIGFRWPKRWAGRVRSLPVNEFLISAHLAAPFYADSAGSEGVVEDERGALLPRTINRITDFFSSYAFSAAYADAWRPEVRRMTLVRLYAVIERARTSGLDVPADLPLLVIKEVGGSHGADLVMSLFPRSRMIFLVRDGRDVLDSLVEANSPGSWLATSEFGGAGLQGPGDRLEFVRENARKWTARMNACRLAYDEHDPELRVMVRYEDLLADTATSLGDLERWFGLSPPPKRIESVVAKHAFEKTPESTRGPRKFRRAARPGGWREGLTPEEQEVAHEIMGAELRALGYER